MKSQINIKLSRARKKDLIEGNSKTSNAKLEKLGLLNVKLSF